MSLAAGVEPVTRIRGRELQRRRARLFARSPWCVGEACAKKSTKTIATIRDHIIPLAAGGTEDEDNEQPLCLDCSDAKTDAEAQRGLPRTAQRNDFRKSATPRDEHGHFTTRRPGWWRR